MWGPVKEESCQSIFVWTMSTMLFFIFPPSSWRLISHSMKVFLWCKENWCLSRSDEWYNKNIINVSQIHENLSLNLLPLGKISADLVVFTWQNFSLITPASISSFFSFSYRENLVLEECLFLHLCTVLCTQQVWIKIYIIRSTPCLFIDQKIRKIT